MLDIVVSILLIISFVLYIVVDKNRNNVTCREFTILLKGFAIFLIIICHCLGSFTRVFTPFGGIGVAIFLILSGYGLNESYKRTGIYFFWVKRVKRVWIPFFIFISVVSLIGDVDKISYLRQISLIQTSYWFIRFIFYCYLIFYLTSYISITNLRLLIIFVSGLAVFFCLKDVEGEQSMSFFVGVLISEKKDLLKKIKDYKAFPIVCFCFGLSFLFLKQSSFYRELENNNGIYINTLLVNFIQTFVKFPIAVAIMLGLTHFKEVVNKSFIYFLGTISYELYIIHFSFYDVIDRNLLDVVVVIVTSI